MSQSIQFEVLDAVATALGGNFGRAYRCRFTDFAVAELPADNVLPEEESSDYEDSDGEQNRFRFIVRHMAAAADGADAVADARYVEAVKLLFEDEVLRSKVRSIRKIGRKWEMDRGELQVVVLVVTYEVEFSTNRSDPSVAGY